MQVYAQVRILGILVIICTFGCGSDNNDTNNSTNNGNTNNTTNNNTTNTGTANNGATNNTTNNGTTNTGTTSRAEIADGEKCSVLDTCIGASFCAFTTDDRCDGICTAPLETGDTCGTGDSNKRCDFAKDACDLGRMTCVPKVGKDASCFTGQCITGLYCKRETNAQLSGICSDLITVDQPCPKFFGCEADLFCNLTDIDAPICTASTLNQGDDCTVAAAKACKLPYQCDVKDTLKCIEVEPSTITCD